MVAESSVEVGTKNITFYIGALKVPLVLACPRDTKMSLAPHSTSRLLLIQIQTLLSERASHHNG